MSEKILSADEWVKSNFPPVPLSSKFVPRGFKCVLIDGACYDISIPDYEKYVKLRNEGSTTQHSTIYEKTYKCKNGEVIKFIHEEGTDDGNFYFGQFVIEKEDLINCLERFELI